MRPGVTPLTPAHEREALAYLARNPFDNVFLSWLVRGDGSRGPASGLFAHFDSRARMTGVAFFGRQVVLAVDDDETIAHFASHGRYHSFERMIVGPRAVMERYWSFVSAAHPQPRITRESQPVFAIEPRTLVVPPADVTVRRAKAADWHVVARNSAHMIQHELNYDPRSFNADFNANVRAMIDRGFWWVGERDGTLCFFCNAGPRSEQTLQLQGIWTPPELRGRGLASAALARICQALLEEAPTLSLYVNDFNAPAIKLYERVGFSRVSEFMTLLF